MVQKISLLLFTLWATSTSDLGGAAEPKLIPRQQIFGNPSRISLQLSPDGRWYGFVAPSQGVLNVWIAPRDKIDQGKVVTNEKKRGIRTFTWSEDSQQILYVQDNDGDENWRVFVADLNKGTNKPISPGGKVQSHILATSKSKTHEILIGVNDRDPKYHDVYRVNLKTGKSQLQKKNEGFNGFIVDDSLALRLASKEVHGGASEYYKMDAKGKVDSKPFFSVSADDSMTTSVIGFDRTGSLLYLFDSSKTDKAELQEMNFKTGAIKTLASGKNADLSEILKDPKTEKPQAVAEDYLKNEWTALDAALQQDIDFLNKEAKGSWEVSSRTDDDSLWTVTIDRVTEPVAYYLYERKAKKITKLFSARPELEGKELAPMYGVEIKARDGNILPSFLSLPKKSDPDSDGKPAQALPMVLFVHGGPWARDSFGYNGTHQWLANRGLAVLSVNYRGSQGFGKDFINKANKEFAGAMHDDLIDAVSWAVQQGIAQKDKVAIMGGSYGGYATLVGMTFTPDTFACGVDIVGPSNLVTLIESFPAYWQPFLESSWYKRVGDPRTEEGKKYLISRSPISKVDQIKKPLLIGQGANDPRVTQKESDQIVAAMKAKSIPVTYALYPDEGHGFVRPENRISFNAVVEGFFAKCLGNAVEPFGSDLQGSTLQIIEGAEFIPGLTEARRS